MNSPKDAGFLFIHAYVFLQIQRESFSIFVGLISDSRLFEWLVLPIYNRYPISDLFLYPSHTDLSLLYSAISCEGCERRLYIRTFGLPQKYQKLKIVFVLLPWCKRTKKSRLRLLSYSVSSFRCARRKLAALRQRRSGRFTSFLRLTLTRTRPVLQLTIENWRLTIFFFSLIYPWHGFRDCRGAALLRLKTTFCTTK